ncbi:MAG: threonine--tRNA ligase [Bacteroidota bacterium]
MDMVKNEDIKIKLMPERSLHQIPVGSTGLSLADSLLPKGKEVLAVEVDGQVWDATRPLEDGQEVRLLTWEDKGGKHAFWHSSAHLLAQALERLYPGVKLGTGPAIERGFYYDVDFKGLSFDGNQLPAIEKMMLKLAKERNVFERKEISKKEAGTRLADKGMYKQEILAGLQDGQITLYEHGDFADLCAGPHLPHTGYIKSVKLTNVAGAYWRGDMNNPQLTRIYGISFPEKALLKEYLAMLEEAKKRDHRKIGKALGFFTFSEKVGLGLPLWLPKGTFIREKLSEMLRKIQEDQGYRFVTTPHIGHTNLYKTSGHYEKYKESSFRPITTPHEDETFMLKPMNCPHHCVIYQNRPHSYRDLPLRMAEFGTVYRYEKHGELHGLTRVRGFTQDDAHIFCKADQLKEEFSKIVDLILHILKMFDFEHYEAQISVRDTKNLDQYLGDDDAWEAAEQAIHEVVREKGLKAHVEEGEAAFYGPKLDFFIYDSLGRKWQLSTIQVDYQLPARFDLTYTTSTDEKKQPIMIHRALLGSIERFMAILLEHTAGKLPFWLAPEQVAVLPIATAHHAYARKVTEQLKDKGIRVRTDESNEKIGRKIRNTEVAKTPYMIVLGDKEMEKNTLAVRKQGHGSLGEMRVEDFLKMTDEARAKVKENPT